MAWGSLHVLTGVRFYLYIKTGPPSVARRDRIAQPAIGIARQRRAALHNDPKLTSFYRPGVDILRSIVMSPWGILHLIIQTSR